MVPRRVLVFTDSRGEHKRSFAGREIFPETLKRVLEARGGSVDLLLCPFKWTTTLDLIELFERGTIDPRAYDAVVVYGGVVEWSPRNVTNYHDCLSGRDEPIDGPALYDAARPRKIANRKRDFLRAFVGEAAFDRHAATDLAAAYRGEPTKNLISREMLRDRVIPYLRQTIGDERLIAINANRVVPGWDGDYLTVNPDGRPANIAILEDYSAILRDEVSNVIDLLAWSHDEVRAFTVDNLHLTEAGSAWIYERLIARLA